MLQWRQTYKLSGVPDQPDEPLDFPDEPWRGQTVIQGRVYQENRPVRGAFVQLLDLSTEFVAEVVSGESGQFRFFVVPGTWIVRVLARTGRGECEVTAEAGVTGIRVDLSTEA